MNDILISILTPTYNRENTLTQLFESLQRQTDYSFEWIIVDDGSTDDTVNLVKKFQKQKNSFPIYYKYINNGGKHRAINAVLPELKSDYTLVVDSDDYLVSNAISKIKKIAFEYRNRVNLGSLIFQRAPHVNTEPFVKFPDRKTLESRHRYFMAKKLSGDVLDVFKTSVLKQYPFPEFQNEKFLSEGSLYYKISSSYISVFVSQTLLIGGYRTDGLTNSIFKKRFESPKGFSYDSSMYIFSDTPLFFRIKKTILYLSFGMIGQIPLKKMVKKSPITWLVVLPSLLVVPYLRIKYKNIVKKEKNRKC